MQYFGQKYIYYIQFQKHGILLVDEISVREAITVYSKTLTYIGLVNHGEDYKATCINEKATSGLVFMFQPLTNNYSQPVAVFPLFKCM